MSSARVQNDAASSRNRLLEIFRFNFIWNKQNTNLIQSLKHSKMLKIKFYDISGVL